jgi:hypothetical protein
MPQRSSRLSPNRDTCHASDADCRTQAPLREDSTLNLSEFHGCGARCIVVRHVIDPRAHGIASHEPRIVGSQQFGGRRTIPTVTRAGGYSVCCIEHLIGRVVFRAVSGAHMLAFNRLRIDLGDGCPALEYRIEDGHVDSRILGCATERSGTIEALWQRLTPEQLRSHVMADTVVARWLSRRMGVHRLIRACNQDSPFADGDVQERWDRTAA